VSPAANALNGQGWHQVGELAVALLLSAAIGLEREIRQKDAGLRTHTLVGIGAALFMLISTLARRWLPLVGAGTSTLRVRYPDGHGILRQVLNEATQRGFAIDDLSTEPVGDRSPVSGGQEADGPPAMVAVTLHVHGKRPVSELASALTDLDLVDAVVAADHRAADE
jgi:hypothetical protein